MVMSCAYLWAMVFNPILLLIIISINAPDITAVGTIYRRIYYDSNPLPTRQQAVTSIPLMPRVKDIQIIKILKKIIVERI